MRKIKILSPGPIRSMGMIHGPIITPYNVDDAKLRSLIREGLDIVEILPDKTEKKLSINDIMSTQKKSEPKGNHNNHYTNDKKHVNKPEPAPVAEVEPVDDPTETTEDVVEEVEQPVEPQVQNNPKVNKHNKYKNNK